MLLYKHSEQYVGRRTVKVSYTEYLESRQFWVVAKVPLPRGNLSLKKKNFAQRQQHWHNRSKELTDKTVPDRKTYSFCCSILWSHKREQVSRYNDYVTEMTENVRFDSLFHGVRTDPGAQPTSC